MTGSKLLGWRMSLCNFFPVAVVPRAVSAFQSGKGLRRGFVSKGVPSRIALANKGQFRAPITTK